MQISERAKKIIESINRDGVSIDEFFFRVAKFYANDGAHANRLHHYMINKMFTPSTPIIGNVPGNDRKLLGFPISCFLSEVDGTNILDILNSTAHISNGGGGLGTLWTNYYNKYTTETSILAPIQAQGQVMRVCGGWARKNGSVATYLHCRHPEIMKFIHMRKNTQGIDPTQIIPRYIHHAVVLSDDFMVAVVDGKPWNLVDNNGNIIEVIEARSLWENLMKTRIETGEPYIMWEDNVNKKLPVHLKKLGLKCKMSNLCTEITLPTGLDHRNRRRMAICDLASINLTMFEKFDQLFISDIMEFLDNVITKFIHLATKYNIDDIISDDDLGFVTDEHRLQEKQLVETALFRNNPFKDALYSAHVERSIGIGTTGFHSYLQMHNITIDSQKAKEVNKNIFDWIKKTTDEVNEKLAEQRGACEDGKDSGYKIRFSHVTAVAPTKNIATIQGVSEGIEVQEPFYSARNFCGSFMEKNPLLEQHLEKYNLNNKATWNDIRNGQYSQIPYMDVFVGPFEINQANLIELAAERNIDQSQSLNLFTSVPVNLKEFSDNHIYAWRMGIKTLYYSFSQPRLSASQFNITDLSNHLNQKYVCEGCQ